MVARRVMLPTLLFCPIKSLRDIDGMAVEVDTFQLKKFLWPIQKRQKFSKDILRINFLVLYSYLHVHAASQRHNDKDARIKDTGIKDA